MTSINTSGTPADRRRFDDRLGVDGHGDPDAPAYQLAEPGGIHHLVGQQQIVGQSGSGHPLDLGDGRTGEGAVAASACRAASPVHLCALTCGRRRLPGSAVDMAC